MSSIASLSSSPNPNSSSSNEEWLYDVFLTFQTECQTIRSLQTSLSDAEIKTFIDDNKAISDALKEAVERSKIVIFVFTKDFGRFKDCLEKLDIIMKCHKNKGKEVWPVLCGVSLSDVRHQMGGIAELVSKGDLQAQAFFRWREAFTDATSLSGRRMMSSHYSRYSKKIRKITHSIKIILDATCMDIPPHLVGVQLRVKEVLHLSRYYSKDIIVREEKVIMVGIWGIGGIGKTTIARIVYDTIGGNFESKSFLESIRSVWEKDIGQVCLQEQLISDISSTKAEKTQNMEIGVREIKEALHNRRALVVLDDVDHIDQFVALCGSREWFGFGSMVLITSRNKHIFDHLKVKYVYEVRKMDQRESLQLFNRNAFKQSNPSQHFINLAKSVITHCDGLPLVVEVLGSLLHDRTTRDWEIVLKKLKSIPASQIKEKLKISCEYLDDSVKDLFFDIACFYVGHEKLSITQKLSGFPFPVEDGIDMLIDRSLVKVDTNNMVHMHELLQEIGKGINPTKSKSKYPYKVFLNFRGDDTRKSFATHLYVALKRAGIEVFMDNGITRGKNISLSLKQAIESSKISIIIFSVKYAGSRWCLWELEKIMECHRTIGQNVLPIFYGVQPSDVRKQIGNFGEELQKLIKRIAATEDQILNWTRVLNEAANLYGWDSLHYRTDAELINHVIETVTMKLDERTYLFVADHPVGVESRVQEVIQLLSDKSKDIMVVGILGMGGIGKTTIAKAIYNEVGQSFESKSFLANIREAWESENGLVHLQEQILSDILQIRMTLYSTELGKAILKERLRHKRALIILDGVNNMDQLKALCGSREWFGLGSRIIITTRDQHILKIIQVDNVYKMKEMDENEALELLSWHAFKQKSPIEDFNILPIRIVAYSEGLPLALEILGSYLFERPVHEWESVLGKLKEIPDDKIQEKLKISYDGLSNDLEKNIFLDICCFFIGKQRNYVTQVLDGCGFHAEIGITRLIELCLVKVDKDNKFAMHSLIRDMGRDIIRQESDELEKRTRLWIHDDVINVLRSQRGSIAIKGLALSLSEHETYSFNVKAFEMMKRLRLLQFSCVKRNKLGHVKLDGNYDYLSKELRWLCWHRFPSNYMPENFNQENLVAIDLKHSHLIQVWKKCQLMDGLKILNLSHSHNLRETPNFSKLPNLERLKLKDCPRLSSIHEAIGDLKCLILINLKGCKDLRELPKSLYDLKSLKTLILSGCSKLEKLEEGIIQMESLTILRANETAITQVPSSLVRSRSIIDLSICGYEGLPNDVFPPLIWSWMSPRNNPRSLHQAFASMPFLLHNLCHSLSNQINGRLGTRPNTSPTSRARTPALIGFHGQDDTAVTENFFSCLTIKVGGFCNVIDTLMNRIAQGWSVREHDCFLPGHNLPDWLAFEDEGPSVSFQVPHAVGHCLKGVVICIIYSSMQDSVTSVYPVSFIIKNFTKASIDFYKRDSEATSNKEEWQTIRSNLELGNEVEVRVDFAQKIIVKKTAVYLVYSKDADKGSRSSFIKGLKLSRSYR